MLNKKEIYNLNYLAHTFQPQKIMEGSIGFVISYVTSLNIRFMYIRSPMNTKVLIFLAPSAVSNICGKKPKKKKIIYVQKLGPSVVNFPRSHSRLTNYI